MYLNLDSKNITQTVKKLSLFICMINKKKSAKTERKRGDSRYKCQLESTENLNSNEKKTFVINEEVASWIQTFEKKPK